MPYTPTVWVNNVTAADATNLNHLETGVQGAAATAEAAIPKAISGVATDKVPVYNGSDWVAQKIVNAQIDAAAAIAYSKLSGVAKALGYGTSLPGSPNDGDEYVLVDSTTAPTYHWRFRYNAGASGSYKWEFIGGSPKVTSIIAAAEQTTSTTYTDLTTAGPSVAVVHAGFYDVIQGALMGNTTGEGNVSYMSVEAGATAATDATATRWDQGWQGEKEILRRREIAANSTFTMKYRSDGSNGYWDKRWMSVLPVRVA